MKILTKKTSEFYHHNSIVKRENTDEIIEGLQFVLVELRKFKPEKMNDRKMAVLWLKFLRDVGENMTNLPEDLANNAQIRKAAELCEQAAFTSEELATYEAYWDIIRTEKTLREGALAMGLKKGETIGLKKGEAIGLEKGKAEEKERIVINSHNAGISIETIAQITNLTVAQVTEILNR